MRRCFVCGETKPPDAFTRKPKPGQYDSYCKPCRAAYGKRHYEANRSEYIEKAALNKQRMLRENMRNLVAYLRKHPCVDCGETDPIVLDFDHLRDKSFAISTKLPQCTWPVIAQEIEKCVVRCSNCHRRRTAREGGFARVAALEPCCGPGREGRPARLLWVSLRSSMRE